MFIIFLTTLLIITGRLQMKTLYFHIQALPRNYIGKCFKGTDEVAEVCIKATSSAIGNTFKT